MPKQTRLESIKYGLLRVVDVSGFKVIDPVIRLLFGEEPSKQIGEITRFMIIPMAFVAMCLVLWTFIAPRHKTKSGEVPAPAQVWNALVINDTLNDRENEKASDFEISDTAREARIAEIEKQVAAKELEVKALKTQMEKIELSVKADVDAAVQPVQVRYDKLKASNRAVRESRKAEIQALADNVAAKQASNEDLLEAIRQNKKTTDLEKEAEKKVKEEINEILADPPKSLKKSQLAFSAAANELQHLKKRLDYLTSGNRSLKVEGAKQTALDAMAKLEQAQSSTEILAAAKSVVRGEEKAEKIAKQQYPRTATIWFQVARSLFTVFVGFLLAAAIAIPVGIMCGLNRVAMACLTPIISVFKPVSPVVWLLIFQIVVGAFFPNPETHPLFLFANGLPLIGGLRVNPALVFSACTVAMCALWPALVNTALGVSSVQQDHLNVAKVLRLGLWARLTKIIIPSSLPLMFAGLRISLGVGWMVLIAAEALSSSEGLGKFVWDEYQNGSSHSFANIIFSCFVIGIIGFILDRMMIVMQRTVSFDDGAAVV